MPHLLARSLASCTYACIGVHVPDIYVVTFFVYVYYVYVYVYVCVYMYMYMYM